MFNKIKEKLKLSTVELVVLALAAVTFVVGVIMLGGYILDTVKSKNASQTLIDAAVTVKETAAPAATDSAKPENTAEVPEAEEQNEIPIEVDFDALLAQNPDIKGWIYSEGTPINTAVPHNGSDVYYLSHSSTKEANRYGTIFIAGRCAPNFTDANTVLYGHDMQNGTILGTLEFYRDQDYYEEHSVMYLLTPTQNYRAVVVAGYMHTADNALYELPNSRGFTERFVTQAIAQSIFDSGAQYNPDANYLTFSTCSDDYAGARLALVCELVPIGE